MVLSIPALADVVLLLSGHGGARYGRESVTQLEHALQCAALAEAAGASPSLVVASLLHDLGHLLVERGGGAFGSDVDDIHQYRAIPFLRHIFPDAVLEPISMHVDAKRYLCHTEPEYRDTLSPASKQSLKLQGGPYVRGDAAQFIAKPFARDAINLRRWDDLAKVPGRATPPLAHYLHLLQATALPATEMA